MKHVFIINSHTTFLSCMGVINSMFLNKQDIMILLVRGYKNNQLNDYDTIDASEVSNNTKLGSLNFHDIFKLKDLVKNKRNIIHNVDSFIDKNILGEYHLYAPHLAHPFWQLIYTHPNCCAFSYIQEGMIPYVKTFKKYPTIKGWIKNFIYDMIQPHGRDWCYRPWFLKTKIKDITKVDSYSINNVFFKYLPVKNHIIKWPLPTENYSVDIKEDHQIFVFDAFVKNGIMSSNDYLIMVKRLIDNSYALMNYLKFHPGESEQEVAEIIEYFEIKNRKYQIMTNDVPLEYLIMTQSNLSFAGYGSSLLFLAYEFGHRVICNDEELMQYPSYQNYKNNFDFMTFREYTQTNG